MEFFEAVYPLGSESMVEDGGRENGRNLQKILEKSEWEWLI